MADFFNFTRLVFVARLPYHSTPMPSQQLESKAANRELDLLVWLNATHQSYISEVAHQFAVYVYTNSTLETKLKLEEKLSVATNAICKRVSLLNVRNSSLDLSIT